MTLSVESQGRLYKLVQKVVAEKKEQTNKKLILSVWSLVKNASCKNCCRKKKEHKLKKIDIISLVPGEDYKL